MRSSSIKNTTLGYEPLRQSIQNLLQEHRGVICDAKQIVITHGAQEAISLCADALIKPNDRVLLENPGYRGATNVFTHANAHITPIDIKEEGFAMHQLPKNKRPILCYTTPTHQYPLGNIMPFSQRRELLSWASQQGCWIIEDDYDSEYHFYQKSIQAVQGINDNSPVIYIGSFSKTLFSHLRVGYMVLPQLLIPAFIASKKRLSGLAPLPVQLALTAFIQRGYYHRHVRKMRQLYKKKWQHTLHLIKTELKDIATPIYQSAGMHITLCIAPHIDDIALKAQFEQHGYGGTPLSTLYLRNPKKGILLGFANTTETERINGIRILRQLLQNLS